MLANYVVENCTSPGTGTTVSLAGAVAGRQTYAQAFTTGSPVFYFLDDGTQAEWGFGTFTTGTPNTVSRSTVLNNTAGTTSRLNFTGATRIYNSLPAGRAIWLDANLAKTNGMIVNGYDASGFNYRAVNGNYGAGIRNDGTSCYLLQTASGSQYGGWNTYRPLSWNLSNGVVTIDATGVGTVLGGSAYLSNNRAVFFNDTGNVARPVLGVDTGNNTDIWLANASASCRVLNYGGTVPLMVINNSGVMGVVGTVSASGLLASGNIQAGTTSGGYVCKAGSLGGFSGNTHNFYWNSPYIYAYIDNTFIGSLAMVSDERYKRAVEPLTDGALSRILSLRPVHFHWRDHGIFRDDRKQHDGLIAQQVRCHIPDAVSIGGDDDTQTINPLPLIAHLVKAIQELSAKVKALEAQING
jgi:hypothetical protein